MARIVGKLKSKQVANARPKKGKQWAVIPDGGNLYLQCTLGKEGQVSRSWLFKYEIAGRRHEIGLGGLHTVGLAEARDKARTFRQLLLEDIDPLAEKRRRRQALITEQAKAVMFRDDAEAYIALHERGWSPKHSAQWKASLSTYCYPKIGSMLVADITSADVLRVVEPLWINKNVTAGRVLDRIGLVLAYATGHKHRAGDNPAANVRPTLPKPSKVATVENFPAVPYQQIGTVMSKLREINTLPATALQFLILCASRAGEVMGCEWAEINIANRVWTIPARRMKSGREHRVPLSAAAIELLEAVPKRDGLVFPIGLHAMLRSLMKVSAGNTVHGMRSAFKTWATEQTAYPAILAEAALAHKLTDSKTEEAYQRTDLFEKRRKMMAQWATFCSKPAPAADTMKPTPSGKIVPIRKVSAGA
jgi:integrase